MSLNFFSAPSMSVFFYPGWRTPPALFVYYQGNLQTCDVLLIFLKISIFRLRKGTDTRVEFRIFALCKAEQGGDQKLPCFCTLSKLSCSNHKASAYRHRGTGLCFSFFD